MLEVIEAGGVLMAPILICSVIALAIVLERLWALRPGRVAPDYLGREVRQLYKTSGLSVETLEHVRNSSPLGVILAAGLGHHQYGREIMKEAMEEAGRQVAHDLESYLNTLGTVAAISPLLGLLGTVFGMIRELGLIGSAQAAQPSLLAGGLAEALVTTAAGLAVAIPALIFYRFFERRVEELLVQLEQEAIRLVEIVHGERPFLPIERQQ